jgi:hypothetical protein
VACSINAETARCIAVDCRTGFDDVRHGTHIGYHAESIDRFVRSTMFHAWLHKFLDRLLEMAEADEKSAPGTFGRGIYHIGCWSNKGPADRINAIGTLIRLHVSYGNVQAHVIYVSTAGFDTICQIHVACLLLFRRFMEQLLSSMQYRLNL